MITRASCLHIYRFPGQKHWPSQFPIHAGNRDRDFANIWRETLEAGYRLKISRLQHNVIGLIGCIINRGENVFTVQKLVVRQNFFN